MRVKVAELEGRDLDRAVALAEGWQHLGAVGTTDRRTDGTPYCMGGANDWWFTPRQGRKGLWVCGPCSDYPPRYSTDWSLAGPIKEREKINSIHGWVVGHVGAFKGVDMLTAEVFTGENELVAVLRAHVASKLGREIEL